MQRTIPNPKKPLTIVKRFDSFADYLSHVDEPHKGGDSRSDNETFTGTRSWGESMDLARNGWAEGASMIERMSAKLECITGSLVAKQVVQWDVAGDFADAGLYSAGVPECMGSFHEEIMQGAGKVVRILFNQSYSSGVGADAIMRRGAAVLALVDALEGAGRSCEIEMSGGASVNGNTFHTLVPIKRAGEAIEMDRLAFLFGHRAAYRRLMFASWENETEAVRENYSFHRHGGYGAPTAWPTGDEDIVVPTMSLFEREDDAGALDWIRAELKRQGCTMEETA